MAYPKHIIDKVNRYYGDLQFKIEKQLSDKTAEIYIKIPRIKKIDEEITSLNVALVKCMINSSKESVETVESIKKQSIQKNAEKAELLEQNGFSKDYLEKRFLCNSCRDTGIADGKACDCYKKKLKEEAYRASNLPVIMDSQSFENFNLDYYDDSNSKTAPKKIMTLIYKMCINYADNFSENSENLLMYGGTGLGKTFLSSCIAKEILKKGKSVYYQPAYRIFSIFEEYKFGNGDKEILKIQIDDIFKSDMLIIDDLGTELVTAYTAEVLFDMLNTRINANKKMIINTNLKLTDLEGIYSPRITSRLIGSFFQLQFAGDDIRRIKAENE